MTNLERIDKIHAKKFEFEKLMMRMSEIITELNALGCDAAVQYEMDGQHHGRLSLITSVQPPPGETF